jgi:hypothetical protein
MMLDRPISWGLAILVTLMLLLWPAWWNGFPIIFADTGGYLARPFEGTLLMGRSALYGAFLAAGMPFDFWPNIVIQAVLCVFVLVVTLRTHGLMYGPSATIVVVVVLTIITGLPFYVTQLMPDIFFSLAILCLYLLAFHQAILRRAERVGLAALVAFAIATHMALLAIAIALLVAFTVTRFFGVKRLRAPQLCLPALSILMGVALLLLSNLTIAGQFRFTPGGTSFLFGRLVQDGIIARYLRERCPNPVIRLCAYRDVLPSTVDDWLWAIDTPFHKLGGPDGFAPEERHIIGETLRLYPVAHIRAAAKATLEQMLLMRTMTSLQSADNSGALEVIEHLAPSMIVRLRGARQQRDGVLDLTSINLLHVPFAFIALSLLPIVIALGGFCRISKNTTTFASTIAFAIVANAAICAIFSSTVDRYQSRLIWLAALAVGIGAAQTARGFHGWS